MFELNSLGLVAAHMNITAGAVSAVLSEALLAHALKAGSVQYIQGSTDAVALLRRLFVEVEPRLIVFCAREAESDVGHANLLYQENLRHGMPRVPAWEQCIRYLL